MIVLTSLILHVFKLKHTKEIQLKIQIQYKREKPETSSKRSASFADSASATIAGGGGPINSSVSSSNSASLEQFNRKYYINIIFLVSASQCRE